MPSKCIIYVLRAFSPTLKMKTSEYCKSLTVLTNLVHPVAKNAASLTYPGCIFSSRHIPAKLFTVQTGMSCSGC